MIAQDIGRNEFDNGYLSDVPGPSSIADSETSSRAGGMKQPGSPSYLVHPNEMEQVFKQKYDFLRDAYEQRIKQLATAIEGGMTNFLSDEILGSMSEHGVTAAYIHQHLAEVFDDHLKNDRERYIHQSLSKISTLETDLKAANDLNGSNLSKMQKMKTEIEKLKRDVQVIEPMRKTQVSVEEKCRHLEKQFGDDREELLKQNEHLQEHNTKTTQQLMEALETNENLEKECEAFRKETMTKTMEVSRLEHTIDQTSQHLEILAREEAQDKDMIPQLQAQIIALSQKMESHTRENYELKYKVRQFGEEYARIKTENEHLLQEQETYKSKTALLMSQVEDIIAQETSESNATIGAIHKKMKDLRNKLALDLQREARLTAALQEEVSDLKSQKELWKRELQQSTEEVARHKQKLEFEEQRVSMMQQQHAELSTAATEAKTMAADANTRMVLAEKKLDAMQKLKKEEMRIVEANAFMQAERKVEAHHDHLEARELAYKLKQRNDQDLLQSQLRHSYSGGEVVSHDLQSPNNMFERIGSMTGNQDIVNESILAGKDFQHQHEMNRLKYELEGEANRTSNLLQQKLEEAMQNMDKLKRIVQDQRSTNISLETQMLNEQQMKMQLETELHQVRQKMLSVESAMTSRASRSQDVGRSQERDAFVQRSQDVGRSQERDAFVQRSQDVGRSQERDAFVQRSQDFNDSSRADNALLQSRDHNNGRWHRNNEQEQRAPVVDDVPDPSLFSRSVNSQKKSNRYGNEMYNSYDDENNENLAGIANSADSAEIQRLRSQVEELETANSSLQGMLTKMEQDHAHHQQEDSMALDEMRGKFESLMSNYGQSGSSFEAAAAHHSAELTQKDQTISMLQQNLRHLTDIEGGHEEAMQHLSAEFKAIHEKWVRGRQSLISMESLYHDHIRGLRSALSQVENTVENMKSQFGLEKDRICREMQQGWSTALAGIEKKHADEVKQIRMTLVTVHDSNEKAMEKSFKNAIIEKEIQHGSEMSQTKSELVGKISKLSGEGSLNTIVAPLLDDSKVDSAELALSAHFKLIIKGMMEALVSSDIVPSAMASELQLLMTPHSDKINEKIGVSASVCVLLREHLSEFLNACTVISNQLETTKRELEKESECRAFNENALNELQQAVGGSNGNMLASPLFASPMGNSKLSNASEEALMNELRLLEYKSQNKVLQERLEEVQQSYKAEMRRLELASSEREATLKRTLEAKYSSILSSDKQLVSELENQLANEQGKRKQLQARLAEDEKTFRGIIQELEQHNHELQTRAEKAEMLVSKLKINNSSYL